MAHDHGPPQGVMRWLTTTNHKDIGTMYLVFSLEKQVTVQRKKLDEVILSEI